LCWGRDPAGRRLASASSGRRGCRFVWRRLANPRPSAGLGGGPAPGGEGGLGPAGPLALFPPCGRRGARKVWPPALIALANSGRWRSSPFWPLCLAAARASLLWLHISLASIVVDTYSAATSGCESTRSTSRLYISYLRGSAIPLGRTWSPAVLAEARQHQEGLRLVRALRRHTIAPDVATYSAAISWGLTSLAGRAMPCRCAGCDHLQCCLGASSTSRTSLACGAVPCH